MAVPEPLRSAAPPRVHLVVLDRSQTPESLLAVPPGFAVRSIDGRRARTKSGLLSEFARALQFPSGSGRNWDAFEELLADLDWLPATGYLVIITDADQLLADHAEDYGTFIEVASTVAAEWATADPPVPFHLCLVVTRARAGARTDWRAPRLPIERSPG